MSEPTSPQTLEWQDELRSIMAIADDHRYSSEAVGMAFRNRIDALRTIPTPAQPTKSAPVVPASHNSGEREPIDKAHAGADTRSSDETVDLRLAERLDAHAIRYVNDYGYNVASDLKEAANTIRSLAHSRPDHSTP